VKIPSLRAPQNKLLLLIFLVFATSTVLWSLRDQTPPAWDPSDHSRYAYDYYRLLAHADFSGFAREFFNTRHYYAPLVHLITAAVFLIFGASKLACIGVNLLSLAALLWALAWMSRGLYAKKASVESQNLTASPRSTAMLLSALPALLLCSYHFSAWLVHDAFLDFPLIAAVTVSFAFLIRAEDFRDIRYALAFGVSAGLGMLVKQTFAFFFVLPAVYVVGRVLWTRDRRAVGNLALAAVVLMLIASIWYAPHWQDVIAIYRENQQAALSENEAPLFTFDSNFFYIHALLSMQMQVPFAILFVFGLLYSLVRYRKESVVLYLWIISGIVCFALVANKDVRYTTPVLPAAALVSTCWIGRFAARSRSKRGFTTSLKVVTVIAIAIWSFVSFFNAQWPRSGFGRAIDTPRYRWMVFARNYYGFDHRPLGEDWAIPEIVQSLSGEASTPVLGVVVNLPYLNPSSVALYSRLLTTQRAATPLIDVRWVVEPSMINRIDECDYILIRTGLDKAEWVANVERDVEKLIRDNPNQFTRYASFQIPLPDAEAVVYRHQRR
jgi:4-amino-4-deoxy-L-arabinose transferase-like glycosyltransferase